MEAVITAALQPIANTIIQIGVPVIPTNALQQMTQTFVDDAISQEVVNHHIDMEYAAADALGSFTGNLIHYQMMQQYQAWQRDRDQKLYQQWLQQQKQQQQQQRRIEELNEEETKIDADIKKLDATINSNDNNDDNSNKNPSYQQRQQQHDDTTSRAQRWNAQNRSVASNDNNVWADDAHQTLEGAGLVTGFKKFENVIGDMWRGANNEWYKIRSSFWGNQYTGSKVRVLENYDKFEKLGKFAYVGPSALSAIEAGEDYQKGDISGAIKDGIDFGMSTIRSCFSN